MLRSNQELPADKAVNFAFAHTQELARLLHDSGHRDMAALLDAICDMGELARRREARGGAPGLVAPGAETLDYVMDQMEDLAELMLRHGVHDAALLFRTPRQLAIAAATPRFGGGAATMAA